MSDNARYDRQIVFDQFWLKKMGAEQGGAVARLRGEGGRVDYYARESRRDAGARFLGLFLFRLSGGIGVGWAPVAARRRRGGAGAGHAAHFVPQQERVCAGLLSAEPP